MPKFKIGDVILYKSEKEPYTVTDVKNTGLYFIEKDNERYPITFTDAQKNCILATQVTTTIVDQNEQPIVKEEPTPKTAEQERDEYLKDLLGDWLKITKKELGNG